MIKQIQKCAALLWVFLMIFVSFVSWGYAEEADTWTGKPSSVSAASTSGAATEASPDPVPEKAGIKAEKTAAGRYYLDFKAASLINVLNVLSNLSGINFVTGSEVADRKINMTLDNVSLEDVLQSITSGSNVSYEILPGRNIYLFRAGSDAPDQPALVTRVFRLYYVLVSAMKEIADSSSSSGSSTSGSGSLGGGSSGDSGSISTVIGKILSARGKVSVDDRSNSLIVTDSEDRLKMVEAAIMQLDRPLDQVLINVLLVETLEDLSRNLGVTWGDEDGILGTVTGAKQTTQWPFRPGATRTTPAGAGISPNGGASIKNFFSGFGNEISDTARQFDPTNKSGAITTEGVRDFSKFQITVTALEAASKLKILAKPKVLVLDNHPAIVKISTNAAIGTTSVTAAAGGSAGTTTDTAERAEVGTILRVTPLINTGDRITMTVEPTFATVDSSAIAIGGGETGDPTVRTVRTTLMINDGQTIAMGGLLISNQSNSIRKVPFFGNLPVVGKALFTSNAKTVTDRELVLFVTPYIIRDPSTLESPGVPDKRLRYDDESAPFWKVKQKDWYKELKEGPEKSIDFDSYFNVRKKLMDATLATLDQNERTISPRKP